MFVDTGELQSPIPGSTANTTGKLGASGPRPSVVLSPGHIGWGISMEEIGELTSLSNRIEIISAENTTQMVKITKLGDGMCVERAAIPAGYTSFSEEHL